MCATACAPAYSGVRTPSSSSACSVSFMTPSAVCTQESKTISIGFHPLPFIFVLLQKGMLTASLCFVLYKNKGYRLWFFQERSNIRRLVELHYKKRECHRPCYVSSFLERECHAKGLLMFRLSWKGIPSMVLSRKIKLKKARGAQFQEGGMPQALLCFIFSGKGMPCQRTSCVSSFMERDTVYGSFKKDQT